MACENALVDPGAGTATDDVCGDEGRLCDACLAEETARQLVAIGGWAHIDRQLNARREALAGGIGEGP